MNDPNSTPIERHYGKHPVILKRLGEVLIGSCYALSLFDEPYLIEVESVSRRWYEQVWIERGWEITHNPPELKV